MTHEQILKTAFEIYSKPIEECSREYGDIDGMIEYLDGAIGELIIEERAAARASFAEEIIAASEAIRR